MFRGLVLHAKLFNCGSRKSFGDREKEEVFLLLTDKNIPLKFFNKQLVKEIQGSVVLRSIKNIEACVCHNDQCLNTERGSTGVQRMPFRLFLKLDRDCISSSWNILFFSSTRGQSDYNTTQRSATELCNLNSESGGLFST